MRYFVIAFTSLLFSVNATARSPMLQNMDGGDIPFESLKGKWVFINYWASWCTPCLHEIPELNRFYQENKHKNIAMFGVNFDGLPEEQQKPLIKEYKLSYPSLSTDPADALGLGDIKGVPVTFVFNPEGKLFAVNYGEQTLETLSAYLS